jgi:regulator of nucleoside diphosphate kinase
MSDLAELPSIVMSKTDHERLNKIAEAARRTVPDVAEQLSLELDRSCIAGAAVQHTARVKMGSHVQFRDNETGRIRSIQLVYPAEADPLGGRISVLTPIGAALIGLSERQTMPWPGRSGERRTLTVLRVTAPHEP